MLVKKRYIKQKLDYIDFYAISKRLKEIGRYDYVDSVGINVYGRNKGFIWSSEGITSVKELIGLLYSLASKDFAVSKIEIMSISFMENALTILIDMLTKRKYTKLKFGYIDFDSIKKEFNEIKKIYSNTGINFYGKKMGIDYKYIGNNLEDILRCLDLEIFQKGLWIDVVEVHGFCNGEYCSKTLNCVNKEKRGEKLFKDVVAWLKLL